MKLKLDENLPAELADDLRAAGHDADTVYDEGLTGAADSEVAAAASSDGRVLLTMDKGLADIRAYPPEKYAGIVLFRLSTGGRHAVRAFVRDQFAQLLTYDLQGRLVIVTERGVRIR